MGYWLEVPKANGWKWIRCWEQGHRSGWERLNVHTASLQPLPLRFLSPRRAQLPAEIVRLRLEHQAGSRSPYVGRVEPEVWSSSPRTQSSFHHLPFIQRLAYPIFFFLLPLQWKALHAQPNKVLCPPHPRPQIPAKKKKEGRLKPGTHLAKGTLVNKKVTHHELQVTPPVILNPLPGDLAQAEFDFMNCEVAMLKVCKLDINWTQKTGGAEWFSF